MIDLTPIINAVIALLAMLITTFLLPWLKANASAKQLEMLQAVCRTLVFAAEQIYGSGMGEKKMAYVKRQLEAKGYTVDVDMIEAVVCENFGKWETTMEIKENTEAALQEAEAAPEEA